MAIIIRNKVNDNSRRRISSTWIILILLLSFPFMNGPAVGQENGEEEVVEIEAGSTEGLTMEVLPGIGQFIRPGCYFPVKVTIENSGPHRKGRLRIVSQDPMHPLTATFIVECDIPTNSRKTYFLYPYFLTADQTPSLYVQYVENTPLATEVIELENLKETDRLWVEVADEGADFTFLRGTPLPDGFSFSDISRYASEAPSASTRYGMGSSNQEPANISYGPVEPVMVCTRVQNLPDRAEGWQSVDGLILNTRRFYEMTQDQKQALNDWIVSGGCVIMWLGEDPNRYQGSFLTGGVDGSGWGGPSAITESPIRTTLSALRNLPAFSGYRDVISDFPVTYTPQESARTLLAEDGVPILQHLRLGRGDILLSGLDLAALKTNAPIGLIDYFSFMMGYLMSVDDRIKPLNKADQSIYGSGYGYNLNTSVNPFVARSLYRLHYDFDNALRSESMTSLPAVKSIALFLVMYIIIVGPLNYFVLLRMRRREWLWYTIPIVVALFVLTSYTWALQTKGSRLMLTRVNIVDAFPNQRVAWESSYLSVFSPVTRKYDIELEGGRDLIRRLETPSINYSYSGYGMADQQGSSREVMDLVQQGKRNETFVDNALIRIWTEMHLESEGAVENPGQVELEQVSLQGNHLTGTLNVSLDYPLEGAFLFCYQQGGFTGKLLEVGQVSGLQNGSVDFDLLMDMRTSAISTSFTSSTPPSERAGQLRAAALGTLTSRSMQNAGDPELILAGWRSGSGERGLTRPGIKAVTEESLILIHIPLYLDHADSMIGGAQGRIISLQAADMEIESSGNLLITDGRMIYSINFPPGDSDIPLPDSLRINIGTDDQNARFDVSIFNHEGGLWEPIPPSGSTSNRAMIKLGAIDRFLAPDGRTMLIKIESDPNLTGETILLNGITINAT